MSRRFTCLLAIAAVSAAAQTVLLQEDFNSGWSTLNPPAGWRIVWDGDTSSNDWHRAPDMGRNPWPDNSTNYALLDSSPLESGFDSLITPPVMCTAYNVVTLTCSTYFRGSIAPYQAFLVGWTEDRQPHIIFDYAGQSLGPELQRFNLDWAAYARNVQICWCFSGESRTVPWWCIDNVTITGRRTSADVGCADIIAPGDSIDSATVVQPLALIRNFGTETASFPVYMEIGLWYRDSVYIEDLAGGRDTVIGFSAWRAGMRGLTDVICYTALPGDINPLNDRRDRTTRVRVVDASVLAVLQPTDTLDSNALITPSARVFCSGEDTATFWAFMRIGNWLDSVLVDDLGPGETRDIQFSSWRASVPGPQVACCSIAWQPDRYPDNNALLRRFFVTSAGWRDASAERVLSPVGPVVTGSSVTVRGLIRNHGAIEVDLIARMLFFNRQGATVYEDSLTRRLAPRAFDTVAFRSWLAQTEDTFAARLQVIMSGDMNPENDTASVEFWVIPPFHDVAVARIISPKDTVVAGPVYPEAWISNPGCFAETFRAKFRITRSGMIVYYDSILVYALSPTDSVRISFPVWNASPGLFVARCTVALDGDANPANDQRVSLFWAESLNIEPGWHEIKPLPKGLSAKPVAHGGGLFCWPNGEIFALKGNKTNEFIVYSPRLDSWTFRESVPVGPLENKRVYKGGCLTGDGTNHIFAIKGNKTSEFYRYLVAQDSWEALSPVPLGTTGKPVRGGTSMVYCMKGDTGFVYLLKGYKNEFYRYNTVIDRWDTFLPPVPLGPSGQDKIKEGSFVAYDGMFTIYCVKAYYNELFAFDIRGDTWLRTSLSPYPQVGRSGKTKKVKDGGSGTFFSGALFTLKGGNTCEFWRYNPSTDSWQEFDTIPQLGSTGKKKRVKGGGAIVSSGRTVFYALKGNKTSEFWRYRIPPPGPGITEPEHSHFPTATNPELPSVVRTRLYLPREQTGSYRLFDQTGRLIMLMHAGENDVSGISPGVYFVIKVGGSHLPVRAKVVKK